MWSSPPLGARGLLRWVTSSPEESDAHVDATADYRRGRPRACARKHGREGTVDDRPGSLGDHESSPSNEGIQAHPEG